MVQQLSTVLYVILLFINTFILCPTIFSMGIMYEHSMNVDEVMLRLDLLKRNRSSIYEQIILNCSELINQYPEFGVPPRIDLCKGYYTALKLGKLVLLLSALYNIYLFHLLFGLSLLIIIIMGFLSTIVYYTDITANGLPVLLLGLMILVCNYFIIVIHEHLSLNFYNRTNGQNLKIKSCLSTDNDKYTW